MNKAPKEIIHKIITFNTLGDALVLLRTCKYFNANRTYLITAADSCVIGPHIPLGRFCKFQMRTVTVQQKLSIAELAVLSQMPIQKLELMNDLNEQEHKVVFPHLKTLKIKCSAVMHRLICSLETLEVECIRQVDELYTYFDVPHLRGPLTFKKDGSLPSYTRLILHNLDEYIFGKLLKLKLVDLEVFVSYKNKDLAKMLIDNNKLNRLTINTNIETDVLDIVPKTVKYLKIDTGPVDSRGLAQLPNLEELVLENCHSSSDSAEIITARKLTLIRCTSYVRDFITMINSMNLHTLVIIGDYDMNDFEDLIVSNLKSLTIHLDSSQGLIFQLPNLEELSLENVHLSTGEIQHCTNITSLSLVSCQLSDYHIADFTNMNLKYLNVSGNKITLDGLLTLKKMNIRRIFCDTINLADLIC